MAPIKGREARRQRKKLGDRELEPEIHLGNLGEFGVMVVTNVSGECQKISRRCRRRAVLVPNLKAVDSQLFLSGADRRSQIRLDDHHPAAPLETSAHFAAVEMVVGAK